MPPIPLEYQGRDVVARLFASIFRSGLRFDLVPTRANGQPAFGTYLRAHTGFRHGTGLLVLTLTDDRICSITRFDNSVLRMVQAAAITPKAIGTSLVVGRCPFHLQEERHTDNRLTTAWLVLTALGGPGARKLRR